MSEWFEKCSSSADLVVLGSGGAGLTCALAAAAAGLDVIVLEKSAQLGGTTAISGGQIWVPANKHMRAAGVDDSTEAATEYLRHVTRGEVDAQLIAAFLDNVNDTMDFVEQHTPAAFAPLMRPDYHPEWAGGTVAARTLDNRPIDARELLGDKAALVRSNDRLPRATYQERHEWRASGQFDHGLVQQRTDGDVRTLGAALVGALVRGCLDLGVKFHLSHDVSTILKDEGGAVRGVRVEARGEEHEVSTTRGVVLACGGFEWNQAMVSTFLGSPDIVSASTPWSTGDNVRLAAEAGAALGNMTEAWWSPMYGDPAEEYEGEPVYRYLIDELALPGSILVNQDGKRFVNEATNYNDLAKAFLWFDPEHYRPANQPAWVVFDAAFKKAYNVAGVLAEDEAPEWFHASPDLATLAGSIGVPPDRLVETARRFNEDARDGRDDEFGRGQSEHDLYYGDPGHLPNPCLAPLTEAPFYAIRALTGNVGTKGGPVTGVHGEVLAWDGSVVPGLYACGNAAASVMAMGYPGSGGSIAPGMTFGYLIGKRAAHLPATSATGSAVR